MKKKNTGEGVEKLLLNILDQEKMKLHEGIFMFLLEVCNYLWFSLFSFYAKLQCELQMILSILEMFNHENLRMHNSLLNQSKEEGFAINVQVR